MNHEESLRNQNSKDKEKSLTEELKKNQESRKLEYTSFANRLPSNKVIIYKGPANQNNVFNDHSYDFENSSENQDLDSYFDDIQSQFTEENIQGESIDNQLHKKSYNK